MSELASPISPNSRPYVQFQNVPLPIARSVSQSNLDLPVSPSNFIDSDEIDSIVGRVSTSTELGFKNATAAYRKLTAIAAVVLLICLFIPGVNVAVLAKAALIIAAIILFTTLVLGIRYFRQEDDQASVREKVKIVFFECLKTLIAPLVCVYDVYKERQRRLAENVDFRVLGTASDDDSGMLCYRQPQSSYQQE